ncbi:MAG TPA: hypothetical protein VFN67_26340 [Polyangiales bacterium]|nr:hypothetical protein [Polyangiales bacterium]
MLLRLAALLLSFPLWAANARASDVDLMWRAPDQGCPGQPELVTGLSQRLQRDVSSGSDADVHVNALVTREPAGYALLLSVISQQGTEQRSMRAAECNELAQATVLISALFIAEAVRAPDVPPPTAASRGYYVRAQLVGDVGTFPAATLGPSVMLGLALGNIRVELGGAHVFSQELRASGAQVGRMQLTTAAVTACYGLLRQPFVAPCLIGELGRLAARGDNLEQRQDRSLLWMMGGVSARASLELLGWLRWQVELAGGFPWDHAQFGVNDGASVHRVASVIARLSTGLEGVF